MWGDTCHHSPLLPPPPGPRRAGTAQGLWAQSCWRKTSPLEASPPSCGRDHGVGVVNPFSPCRRDLELALSGGVFEQERGCRLFLQKTRSSRSPRWVQGGVSSLKASPGRQLPFHLVPCVSSSPSLSHMQPCRLLHPTPSCSERRGQAEAPDLNACQNELEKGSLSCLIASARNPRRLRLSPTAPLTSAPDPTILWVPYPRSLQPGCLPGAAGDRKWSLRSAIPLPLVPKPTSPMLLRGTGDPGCCFLLLTPSPKGSMLCEPRCGSQGGGGCCLCSLILPPSWDRELRHS